MLLTEFYSLDMEGVGTCLKDSKPTYIATKSLK